MKSLKLLVLVAGVLAAPLAGQAADSTEMRVAVNAVRERGRSSRAIQLLSGERANLSARELDTIADELVTIAVAFDGTNSREKQLAALPALGALVGATFGEHPVPYAGAFDRVRRIYEESPAVGIRSGALMGMTRLPNAARAIAFMETVATSNTILADNAVRHLGFDMGPAGVASLRGLYEADAVVLYRARIALNDFAASKGWKR